MTLVLPAGVMKKAAPIKALPPVPQTGWRPPTEFPDLRGATVIAIDTETKDPELLDYGPGWGRNRGHIIGFSMCAEFGNGQRWIGYVPIRHEFPGENHLNCNVANSLAWLKAMMETPIPKVLTNGIYDVGWLAQEGIYIQGELYDVQYAEALLDERGETNLDWLATKYLGRGKDTNILYEFLAKAYGGKPNESQKANFYRAPPSLVGHYGEDDAWMPLDILRHQWPLLQEQGLIELFKMECGLIRLLVKMRMQGVRVDRKFAEELYVEFDVELAKERKKFFEQFGVHVNVNSPDDLAKVFALQGVAFPRTEGGAPSFTKDWLKNLEHPLGKAVNQQREYLKLQSTFIKGYLLDSSVNDLVHCSFHPLRGAFGGTITGRFASSSPNLQNIPKRSKIGKRIRNAFIPHLGHAWWEKNDYSQIEYRMLAHFACDDGDMSADALRQSYIDDPDTDYHNKVYAAVCAVMGWDYNDVATRTQYRPYVKNTNFGLLYGQGIRKLMATMGFTKEQADNFFAGYHAAAPYVKPTMKMCEDEVHQFGYVRTILGRRTHFDLWEPLNRDFTEESRQAVRFEIALERWGSAVKRAYGYRAVNYKLQGSAADMMKIAMYECDRQGVFDVTGVPVLTVHDELDFSVIDESPMRNEAHRHMVHIMEHALPCRVPIRVDGYGKLTADGKQANRGVNWGAIE